MISLELRFEYKSLELPELTETYFSRGDLHPPCRSVRGKVAGAFFGYGTFQWTRAVQALSLLFVRAKVDELIGAGETLLVGDTGSFAASLDYALDKRTIWLMDMFGVELSGRPILSRILSRTNSNRKRPGPVVVALNKHYISANDIQFFSNGVRISEIDTLQMLCKSLASIEHRTPLLVVPKAA